MRFPEAWLEPTTLSRHFRRYFKSILDTNILVMSSCAEDERCNLEHQYSKVDVYTLNKYLRGFCKFLFVNHRMGWVGRDLGDHQF